MHILGLLGVYLQVLLHHVPGVGGARNLTVLVLDVGLDHGGVAGLALVVAEEPLLQIGSGGGLGIAPLLIGLGHLIDLSLDGGIDGVGNVIASLLVGVGIVGLEDGLGVADAVHSQQGGADIGTGLVLIGILDLLVYDVGVVVRLVLLIQVVVHQIGLDLVGGLELSDGVLHILVSQLVGGNGGGVEVGLVLVCVLLDLLGGDLVALLLEEVVSELDADVVVLHGGADVALAQTLADPAGDVLGQGDLIGLGLLLQALHVLVHVSGGLLLELVELTGLLGTLAVGQVLLGVLVGGGIEIRAAPQLGKHEVDERGGVDLAALDVATGGIAHDAPLDIHILVVELILSHVVTVDVNVVLVELEVLALGGSVQSAHKADGVKYGVAQDGYDKHEGHGQNERDVGKFALGRGLLIHGGKSFLLSVSAGESRPRCGYSWCAVAVPKRAYERTMQLLYLYFMINL